MNTLAISPAQSRLKLAMWSAEVESLSSGDFYIWLQETGLPESVVTRLHELVSKTMQVGEKLISIGKVLLFKILSFVKENPCLVAGAGIGAAVGAAIYSLICSLPLGIGAFLEPIAKFLCIGAFSVGVGVGHSLDREIKNISQNLIEAARDFFHTVIEVLQSISKQTSPA